MSELSSEHKVIYVNQRRELREIVSNIFKIKNWHSGIRRINKNLLLIESPWIFPKIYKLESLDIIIDWLYHRFIWLIAFLWGNNCTKILYIWEPGFSSVRRYYRNYIYIYHPYDMYDKYTYVLQNRDKGISKTELKNESDLVHDAFLFYSVTELLCDHYHHKFGRRPKLLPNAVQDIYFGGDDEELQEASRKILAPFPTKKVGISGSIIGSLDLDLIMDSAKHLEDYTFLFMGIIRCTNIPEYDEKLEKLFSVKNVVHLGSFDVKILPYLLREMDVLAMIYSCDRSIWTHYGGPSKLFEYMAIGKPIISTPHPALGECKKYISIVENSEQLISAMKRIETGSDELLLKEMVQTARKNTWKERVNIILEDLSKGMTINAGSVVATPR